MAASSTTVSIPSSNGPVDTSKYTVQVITKYMCRYCAQQFDSPSDMQAHIQNHLKGKAPHSCSVCGKEYRTPSKLQRHVRVHSGERPYACNLCGRRFTRSDHVKQHMKVHLPQRQRNECRICNVKFMRRQTLHHHLLQHHKINQVYTCHRCGEAFDEIQKLHTHKESHMPVPTIEIGGVKIKQEPGDVMDDKPTTGLAKFSLGPQPPPTGDEKSVDDGDFDSSSNLSSYNPGQENATLIDTDFDEQINQAAKMAIEASFTQSNGGESVLEDLKKSTTIMNGNEMYIVPTGSDDSDSSNVEMQFKKEHNNEDDLSKGGHFHDPGTKEKGVGADLEEQIDKKPTEQELKDAVEKSKINAMEEKANAKKPFIQLVVPQSSTAAGPSQPVAISATDLVSLIKTTQVNSLKTAFTYSSGSSSNISQVLGPQVVMSARPGSILPSNTMSNISTTQQGSYKYIKPALPQVTISTAQSSNVATLGLNAKRTYRCDHCLIYFEDLAMSMLHNSLHSADEADPFTCRKCMKKLGNRLEFTAHLIWHLEPNMDI
ncbi:hypothetical protein ACJMK2_002943 [Sinanodonta woodiana]|uniref:C2H2-type domain-containing protein n=1 Tax=Sinanodonta woodiana TaxID=1069815 RepID=A0ABD3XZZ4_SINWO